MNHPSLSFTVKYDRKFDGVVTEATIGLPFDPSKNENPNPGSKYFALWDTGASRSVITQRVVDESNLQPVGMTKVHTAAGETDSLIYLVSVHLPNNVWFFSQQVTVAQLAGNIDVLIGMDIIGMGDFAITHSDGKTTFSFRFPSSECIDFVKVDNKNAVPKVSRNAPCPCGSGKKYKYCHGR